MGGAGCLLVTPPRELAVSGGRTLCVPLRHVGSAGCLLVTPPKELAVSGWRHSEVRWSGAGPAACADPTAHTVLSHGPFLDSMVCRIILTSKKDLMSQKKALRSKTVNIVDE